MEAFRRKDANADAASGGDSADSEHIDSDNEISHTPPDDDDKYSMINTV